ncbi:hypothetical protein [Paenibacillus eucommiae]|uniref:Lipoprotein n=1 Tax=Paenibacillus eucommiae TaxID=1355755 RepID=A0ABS4ISL3_9BACL|nr:hypothetical protein [Paenibacillus eucommiae]MBP1990563.1 hypothetical protein [Paenibacillus eucommiae]
MKNKLIFILLIMLIVITGCAKKEGYSSPEEALNNSGVSFKGLLTKVELPNAALTFYLTEDPNMPIGTGFIREKKDRWQWITGSSLQQMADEPVTYNWVNLDKMRVEGKGYHMFWGVINQQDIEKIYITYKNNWNLDGNATILDTGLGYRIWYVISNEYHGTVPGVDITGYSGAGTVVYTNR